jgi:PIN domain nuclease of toxin-antitoxin system
LRLLDTHIWLWSRVEPDRLSTRVARRLRDPRNELWLSPISVWEAMLLIERGRIEVEGSPAGWIRSALATGPLRNAPLDREVALTSRSISGIGDDPADRFIAASAIVHELTLVTADRRLTGSKWYRVLSNQ